MKENNENLSPELKKSLDERDLMFEKQLDKFAKEWTWPFFCYYVDEENFWFRFYGYGLSFTKSFSLFSERNGFRKKFKLWKGWRMGFLKK